MKVLGISGSPRKDGNTEIMMGHALKAAAEEGLETELVRLADLDIGRCNSCDLCRQEERCSLDDDLFPLYLRMKDAQAMILASPVYFGSATALMKSFIERAGIIALRNGQLFAGKAGGAIVVARRAGHNFTLAEMTLWFQILGMVVPGSTYWNIGFGRKPGDVAADEEGMKTAWQFGKNIAWLARKLARE